ARQQEALVGMGDTVDVGTRTLKDPLLWYVRPAMDERMFLPRHERIRRVITICTVCDFPGIAELVDHYLFEETCPAICLACAPLRWYRHWCWSVFSHLRHRGVRRDPDDVPHSLAAA
ncbi:MAG: hypothetical protein ACM3ZV_00900, partial [Bacillota bacterium]